MSSVSDDLTIIEGIGPKLAEVLGTAGITTFRQLAATTPEHLQQLIAQAGIRIGDPTTWAEQAALAASGNLQALRALQDTLKGGRRVYSIVASEWARPGYLSPARITRATSAILDARSLAPTEARQWPDARSG